MKGKSTDDFLSERIGKRDHGTVMGDWVAAEGRLKALEEKRGEIDFPTSVSSRPTKEEKRFWEEESKIYRSQEGWRTHMGAGGSTFTPEDVER